MFAAHNGHEPCVRALADAGCNVDLTDSDGNWIPQTEGLAINMGEVVRIFKELPVFRTTHHPRFQVVDFEV